MDAGYPVVPGFSRLHHDPPQVAGIAVGLNGDFIMNSKNRINFFRKQIAIPYQNQQYCL